MGSAGHPLGHLAYKRPGSFCSASKALFVLFGGPTGEAQLFSKASTKRKGRAERPFRILPPGRAGQGDQGPQASTALLPSENASHQTLRAAAPWGTKTLKGWGGARRER